MCGGDRPQPLSLQASGDTARFPLGLDERGKRGFDAQMIRTASVQTSEQRLHEPFVQLGAEAAPHEGPHGLVAVGRSPRDPALHRDAGTAPRTQDPRGPERAELGGHETREPVRKRHQGPCSAYEGARPARLARDQLVAQAEFVRQGAGPWLASQKAVGGGLDDEAVEGLGQNLAAQSVVSLEQNNARVERGDGGRRFGPISLQTRPRIQQTMHDGEAREAAADDGYGRGPRSLGSGHGGGPISRRPRGSRNEECPEPRRRCPSGSSDSRRVRG